MKQTTKQTDWSLHRPLVLDYKGKWVYNWFSNMALSNLEIDGEIWMSVENYFQAMKTLDPIEREEIKKATPSGSKALGRQCTLRDDWDDIKVDIMKKALNVKFRKTIYKDFLLATGDSTIIEWNNWSDKFYGVTINDNKGMNILGLLLMDIRDEIKKEES